MDKNTLSHYGWIIVVVIIIAILLGCSASFASAVKNNFIGITNRLTDEIDEAFDVLDQTNGNDGGASTLTAYALVLEPNVSTYIIPSVEKEYGLVFTTSTTEIKAGDIYITEDFGDMLVTAAYTDFLTETYTYDENTEESTAPWASYASGILAVIVEDEIAPLSTAYWFTGFESCSGFNLVKLDTSNVTDMSGMFALAGAFTEFLEMTGLETWDVSSVTNMDSMFVGVGYYVPDFALDLSHWDVSSVTTHMNFNLNANGITPPAWGN